MQEEMYLETLRTLWKQQWPNHLPSEPNYPFGEVPLTTYLQRWAERQPDHPVLIYYGREVSFRELDDLSSRFSSCLADLGLTKGDRVAVFLPNCPQFHIAFYGILKLGCVHVPVNPMFKELELIYELSDSGARVIVTLDQFVPLVQSVVDQTPVHTVLVTRFSDFLPQNPTIPVHKTMTDANVDLTGTVPFMETLLLQKADYPNMDVGLDDVVAFNYTGGTTGMPKGCEHTQRDMIYTAATSATYTIESKPGDISLIYVPIFWIAGENSGLIAPVFTGNTCILLTRWDAEAVLTAIDLYKVTNTGGVVDNLVELMEHPRVPEYDLTSLKTVLAMSFIKKMNVSYRRRWQEIAGAQCVIREGAYGMTETHTMDTFTNGFQENNMDLLSEPVFCGLPMPGTEFKIVDFATRELLPLGEKGEIVIRTPSLLKSYWNKPEASQQSLQNGWFYTGDIGVLDEQGFLHFLGRKKEMLKVRGMSVFPSEIETLLGRHPAIEGSAVVGRPDAEKGEVPVAFIKLCEGALLSEADLDAWCRQNMATYKVPEIRIISEFPLTTTGKVKKEELKKLF
ncbi:AMP-binding protein [Effusibacillus dendaii]|uniref:Acyl-CoA synthetase n=1 Tax=Effusibacillus dendaii TaxID=2743772 RepID=A0A7I8D820_9BACL|nr:AMP-binding protein [Effusibacillus dendaii]BCJ85522.1 acyl-CoA synthetase [Effusibacillus dendaii]